MTGSRSVYGAHACLPACAKLQLLDEGIDVPEGAVKYDVPPAEIARVLSDQRWGRSEGSVGPELGFSDQRWGVSLLGGVGGVESD